jgi:hypothetical protein
MRISPLRWQNSSLHTRMGSIPISLYCKAFRVFFTSPLIEKHMARLLLVSLFLLMAALPVSSQTQLGFTNGNGFPDIVTHQQYNLSGWIKNNGTATLSGSVDIRIQVNGGNSQLIDNNFNLPTALAPGDSTLWTKNGHSFPPGQFAPGQNDVLIWPTKTSGPSVSDTIKKPIFFAANSALFALKDDGLYELHSQGVSIDQSYRIVLNATNVGGASNLNPIGFYLKVGEEALILLRQREQLIAPSQAVVCEVEIPALRTQLEGRYGTLPNDFRLSLNLYAEELNGLPYFSGQTLLTQSLLLAAPAPSALEDGGPAIFPVPSADGLLQIGHSNTSLHQVVGVRIYSLDGRLVAHFASLGQTLDLSHLQAGTYLLKIEHRNDKTWMRKFVRQ